MIRELQVSDILSVNIPLDEIPQALNILRGEMSLSRAEGLLSG
jgi:lipopolysaccharide/colanic/teichoic acid biosynthesis glycosyltransferase